jgi:hypothetical protein
MPIMPRKKAPVKERINKRDFNPSKKSIIGVKQVITNAC